MVQLRVAEVEEFYSMLQSDQNTKVPEQRISAFLGRKGAKYWNAKLIIQVSAHSDVPTDCTEMSSLPGFIFY